MLHAAIQPSPSNISQTRFQVMVAVFCMNTFSAMHENDDLTEALVRSGLIRRRRVADPPLPTPSPSTSPADAISHHQTTPASPTLSIYDYWHSDYDYGNPYRERTRPRLVDFGNKAMSDNTQPNGSGAPNGGGPNAAGMAFYEKTRSNVRDLIARRKMLEKKLVRFLSFPSVVKGVGGIWC